MQVSNPLLQKRVIHRRSRPRYRGCTLHFSIRVSNVQDSPGLWNRPESHNAFLDERRCVAVQDVPCGFIGIRIQPLREVHGPLMACSDRRLPKGRGFGRALRCRAAMWVNVQPVLFPLKGVSGK